jgi:ectoine hydroxylase-related dioxygenase (phytanoyl-CoA dioxygenase family)
MLEAFTPDQLASFAQDGLLIVPEGFVEGHTVERLRERFDEIFAQRYETGIRPDEVNWVAGHDPEDRTRQICNGWKADRTLADQVLSERSGRLAASLMGWDGIRILHDNCLWKPPGTKSLGMHQDDAYLGYVDPSTMISCWIGLDDTSAQAGTMSFVRGSHRWPRGPENRAQFHAPPDWLEPAREANPAGADAPLELVPVEVRAGGASFHHGNVWHGSGPNTDAATHRRALVSHLVPAAARFDGVGTEPVYSRYRRRDSLEMDESYFPILWTAAGGRSEWLGRQGQRASAVG